MEGLVGIWVAVVATLALKTWRHQLKVEKQLAFIDEATSLVHQYIILLAPAISHLKIAKISIDAHRTNSPEFDHDDNAEAIAFISKRGQETSQNIFASLEPVAPILSKMQSLAVKGQVLNLPNYGKFLNACEMLVWSYNQLQAFGGIIHSPSLNWENPRVQEMLNSLPKFDANRISTNLEQQNKEIMEFAKEAYRRSIH